MCRCVDVSLGSYSNTTLLGYYPVMREYHDNRVEAGMSDYGICVDSCIVDQVVLLWENGVRTYGSCCGHNKVQGMINVDERDYEKAISLGFEPYVFSNEPSRKDTVKTKQEEKQHE